jgi:hypothetical protein
VQATGSHIRYRCSHATGGQGLQLLQVPKEEGWEAILDTDAEVDRAGNATKRMQSVALSGWIACTRTICKPSTTYSRHSGTLVRHTTQCRLISDDAQGWTSKQITYGLYLSDHSILNDVETELTVLSGIMIQNLPRETAWHLRGTRRIGVGSEDVETIQQCVSAQQPWVVRVLSPDTC